jgi:predicted nucleotidyltransferase
MISAGMQKIVEKLKSFFEKEKQIQMAFLFGSAAIGREISESDVDVAVWFKNKYSMKDVNRLQDEIEDLLHRNLDLIVLNQARPTIAWAAMRGKPLIIRDYRLFFSKLVEISVEAEDIQDFVIDLFWLREKARREANQ